MAQQTALSVLGIPGAVHAFVAKTAVITDKLYTLIAAQTLVDGAVAAQTLVDGGLTGQSLVDGIVAVESRPN